MRYINIAKQHKAEREKIMKLRTQHGKWHVTDGSQVVTFNSSAEAWQYILNEDKKGVEAMDKDTPIKVLTDALATMTLRATLAERERDEAKARSIEWYKKWEQAHKEANEVSATLANEIREHRKAKTELEEAVRTVNILNDELERLQPPKKATESR